MEVEFTLHNNETYIHGYLDQLPVKSPSTDFFLKEHSYVRPNFDPLIGICGIPEQHKKSYTKLTVIKNAVRFLIRSKQSHLAAVSASRCHCRKAVD